MAGPSVMVRILGDVSNLANNFKKVGDQATGAAGKAHQAFTGMLATLNQTGVLGPLGDAINSVDTALGQLAEHGKGMSTAFMAAGATTAGLGVALSGLGSKEKQSQQQLAQAIANTGHSYDQYGTQVDAAIKHQEKFGNSAVETRQALQILTQATGDPAKAIHLLGEASDLAAAKHEDLASAATALGKVYNGNTKLLKEFGVQATSVAKLTTQAATASKAATSADHNYFLAKRSLADIEAIDAGKKKLSVGQTIQLHNAEYAVAQAATADRAAHLKLTEAQQAVAKATSGHGTAVDLLGAKLKGQASASADTFSGHMKAIKTELEDQVAMFGAKYGPALTGAGAALTALGSVMKIAQAAQQLFTTTTEVQTAATEAQAVAEDTAAVSTWAALAPIILIIAAIALLVAAAYVIWRNWKTIWADMKAVVADVWQWIKDNWPYLLGIITGPIGLAAAAVYKNWDSIKGAAQAVFNWFVNTWNTLYGVIANPIKQAISDVTGWFNNLVSFVTGLPGTFGRIFGSVASAISGAFKAAFNAVASFWNGTVGSLSFHLPSWVPGLGGKGFDMPKIPLMDQGGLITKTGLIIAHAGEAIIPAPGGTGRPAVHIEHAHFASAVDVDLFMRRAAWLVQTTKV